MIGKIIFWGSIIILVGLAIIIYIRHPENWLLPLVLLAIAAGFAAIGLAKKAPKT